MHGCHPCAKKPKHAKHVAHKACGSRLCYVRIALLGAYNTWIAPIISQLPPIPLPLPTCVFLRLQERLGTKMSELVKTVAKCEIPEYRWGGAVLFQAKCEISEFREGHAALWQGSLGRMGRGARRDTLHFVSTRAGALLSPSTLTLNTPYYQLETPAEGSTEKGSHDAHEGWMGAEPKHPASDVHPTRCWVRALTFLSLC